MTTDEFARAVCAEYYEHPDDPTQPFAGYAQVLEWVKESRSAELDYIELGTCPMCEEGYVPHECMSYLDLVKEVRKLKAELAKFHVCDDGDCVPGFAHEGWAIWHRDGEA